MGIRQTSGSFNLRLFIKKRVKLAYLLFFIIPLTYFLLWKNQAQELSDNSKHSDYLSFSVKSTNPARLSLVEKERELVTWNLNSKGYKNLEFVGPINSNDGINLKANNLNINDTLSFLEINLYSNNKLFTLNNDIKQNIDVTNARIAKKDGILILIVEKSGTSVNINLKSPTEWGKSEPFNAKKLIIALVFLFVFLSIFGFNPSARYFILTLTISIFILTFSYFADRHSKGKVTLFTSSKIRNAEVFYSQTPFFSITKRYSSERTTDNFSHPLNLETEKYLRFDIGDSLISLKKIKIKISSGIFSKSYNLSELPQDRLLMNDMVLVGNTYNITGNDPYIKFTSKYFINDIGFLLFLDHNTFLFLTLIFFLFFISLNGLIDKKLNKFKLKPAYFTFLLIPIVYYLISQLWINKSVPQNSDYVYFSTKTSHPSVITLINGSDSITSWTVNSSGFKYLQYKGHLNINENFFLKISKLSNLDTVSFLSINLFHDNKSYSLFEKNNTANKISNASYTDNSNDFIATVKKAGTPVTISLLPSNLLERNTQEESTIAILIFIVFLTFLFVLIISPNQRFFIISSVVTSLMMVMFFWMSHDSQSLMELRTSSPSTRVDFFYNDNPNFVPNKIYLDITSKNVFKFQILPYEFKFCRCDIGENNEILKDIFISIKTGILSNNWDYKTIPSENILLNDMKRYGEDYQVCGNDPFITLSSAYQINKMQSIFLIRQNLFFFLSILLFIILIVTSKHCKKDKLSNFFLVVFFLVFIFTGLIIHLFNSENLVSLAENRCTNRLPTFQIDSSTVYTKGLDNYILDQLPGRKYMIKMNNLLQYTVFKQLINSQIIHFGEDGWMFYIAGPAKENYENRHPLTIEELNKIKNVLIARNNWLRDRGMHFYLVFPPMPQTVYKEFVGPRMRQYYKQTKIEQLLEYLKLNTDLDIIDVYTPLMQAKNSGFMKPYYKDNCHWNYYGGYVAYCSIINYLKKDIPNIGEPLGSKDFKWVESKGYRPDLLQLMDIDKFFRFNEYKPSFNQEFITDTIYPFYLDLWTPTPPACVRTKSTNYLTMFMYGDSYAGNIFPFLFYNFSKSIFIWTPLFQPLIIEKEKPDIVIQEMVDASIINILLKNKPLPELKDSIPVKPE